MDVDTERLAAAAERSLELLRSVEEDGQTLPTNILVRIVAAAILIESGLKSLPAPPVRTVE